MKTIKIITRVFGAILVSIFVCGLLLWTANNSLCKSKVFQEIYSPNGKYKTVIFERNCGATTGFRTHISVIKSDIELGSQRGNVFQADGYPDWFSIKAVWADDQHVIIESNGKSIPDVAKNKVGNIEVQYVENTEGVTPPRSFEPSELLLSVSYFPNGWIGEEKRPMGPEVIKGSSENSPYMLYTPPPPAKYPEVAHYVTRFNNANQAIDEFRREKDASKENYSANCKLPMVSSPNQSLFQSEYSKNYFVGYGEHQDGSDEPGCKFIAQYDEFFIEFDATISENGLTYEQFNSLIKIVDQIMVKHIKQ